MAFRSDFLKILICITPLALWTSVKCLAGTKECQRLLQPPPLNELILKHLVAQSTKERGRSLKDYNDYLFKQNRFADPLGRGIFDFLVNKNLISAQNPTLSDLLSALQKYQQRTIFWVDLGAGLAIPQRQMKAQLNPNSSIQFIAVDLVDWEKTQGDKNNDALILRSQVEWGYGVFNPKNKPSLIIGNAENIHLPFKPDFISSVETIQYINDKLGFIVNWYNQLADGGLLFIAADHSWPDLIYGPPNATENTPHLFDQIAEELSSHGIVVALNKYSAFEPSRKALGLLIEKKPRTSLSLQARLTEVEEEYFYKYISSTYSYQAGASPIKVHFSSSQNPPQAPSLIK